MKRKLLLPALFLLLLPSSAGAQTAGQEKLKLGMLLTLSGNFASAGEDGRKGAEAGLATAGAGSLVDVVYADSRNEPAAAVSEFRRLVDVEKVFAVYTHRGPIGMSLNSESRKTGIPLLGAVGNKDFAAENEFAVQIWPRSDVEGEFLALHFANRKYERAALIYTEDDWTGAVSRGFRDKYSSLGHTPVLDQSVMPGETDFRTLLAKTKRLSPDAVYLNMLLPQIGLIIKQAREIGLGGTFYCNFYVTRKDVSDTAGTTALEGVMYVEADNDLPALKAKLSGEQAEEPAGLTVASYMAVLLAAQAAAETKGMGASKELHAALLRQREIRTPDHVYPIVNRYVQFPLVLKTVRSGRGVKTPGQP